MVLPRFNEIDRIGQGLRDVKARREGMVRRGRLISVDFDGMATVDVFGRLGQTARIQAFSMVDDPEGLIGLTVSLLVPTGNVDEAVWVLGPDGAAGNLAAFNVLEAVENAFLEARNRAIGTDVTAWAGEANVLDGQLVVITSISLTVQSLKGLAVMRCGSVNFQQVGYDHPQVYLRPAQPFRATADFSMELTVDRASLWNLDDAVLLARYTTEPQPAGQRLQVRTTSGAGAPYMAIKGRIGQA